MECSGALATHLGVAVKVSETKQSAPHAPCGKCGPHTALRQLTEHLMAQVAER